MALALNVRDIGATVSDEAFRAEYLQALRLIERLHRLLLDVIKNEFDRLGGADLNSVQALLLYNIGDAADLQRAQDPRLLPRLEHVVQFEEARRHGLVHFKR